MTATKAILELNLSSYVPLEECHWSDVEISRIKQKCYLSDNDLRLVLKWNILTVPQVALLSNTKTSTVRNALTPIVLKNGDIKTRLCMVNVFPDTEYGKHFILVDDFCRKFILK